MTQKDSLVDLLTCQVIPHVCMHCIALQEPLQHLTYGLIGSTKTNPKQFKNLKQIPLEEPVPQFEIHYPPQVTKSSPTE